MKQDAIADVGEGIDSLADGAGGIATFERYGGDQQVGEGMEHDVGFARKVGLILRDASVLGPATKATAEGFPSIFDALLLLPAFYLLFIEADENSLP